MRFRSRLTPQQRQQGNTLVGIIIGLIVGLAIAVVVALVISKGSSPFTDKGSKAGKPTEPTAGQISDPNKPMYGNKDAAREAARDFAKVQTPAQPAEGVPPPAAPPVHAPAPAPAAKDELQQVVDRIEAAGKGKTAATPAPATPAVAPAAPPAAAADDKYVYYLQAGAFRELADAESQRAKLALMGFEAAVSDRSTDAGVLHRVRMGPYTQVESMNKARSKLSENGVDVSVVRNQR